MWWIWGEGSTHTGLGNRHALKGFEKTIILHARLISKGFSFTEPVHKAWEK